MGLKTYLLNRIDARRFRLNGIIPSNRLPSKQKLCQAFRDHVLYAPADLPHKVDLRSDMTPVEDQSRIGSCVANCLAGAYEYLTKKSDRGNTDVSRLFIYYNGRARDGRSKTLTDSGCTMTSAIEALEEFGTCLESIWPYNIPDVNTRPSDRAYQEAKNHKITEALQIEINLNEMKSCLAQGFPFAFGLRLFKSFDKASTTGVVPAPNASDRTRSSHGCHALLAVGYSDHSRSFIVRNSWGADWGDGGYCYIPYDYMTNPDLCFDAWAVRKLSSDDFGREHWDNVDAVNYLKAAVIELMSMGNSNSNVDDNCAIEDIVEDEEPDHSGHSGVSGYQNNQGWQRHGNTGNNGGGAPPPPWHQQQHINNSYPGNNFPPYHNNQQQQYGNGFQPNNNNYGGYFPNQYQNNLPPYPPHGNNHQPSSMADYMNSESQNQQFGMGFNYNNAPYNYPPNQYRQY
ncbi:hypothetical protein I4U23_003743 [Adineta vaga]|nr:hypothetical protein I4U23_003743 [Adineta vaga]